MSSKRWCTRHLLAAVCLIGFVSATASAQQAVPAASNAARPEAPLNAADAALKKTLEQRLGIPQIDALARVPYGGLIEVRIGTDVIYTDPKGEYVFVGNVINTRTMENLTKVRIDALVEQSTPKIKFADLPLDAAIKYVKGNGKRRIAVFADPNCTFCKRFEKTLQDVNDVTVYVFLYPILGPDSIEKSKSIWCSTDRAKTWQDWMLAGTLPIAPGTCKTPIDRVTALGKQLRVDATPTLVFSNGRRVPGALPTEELKKILAQLPT